MSKPTHYLETEFYDLVRGNEEIFSWLSQRIFTGLWYCDLNTTHSFWASDSFWKSIGVQQIPTKSFESWKSKILEEDKIKLENFFPTLFKNSSKINEEVIGYKKSDNETVWLKIKCLSITSEKGINDRLLVVHEDVTKIKLENQTLLEQNLSLLKVNEIYEETNELARIGGWELDLVANKLSWTKVTKDIHEVDQDYEPDLENGIKFYKEGYNRNRITELVNKVIIEGGEFSEELEIVSAKGNPVWVKVFGRAEMVDGKCVRLFGAFKDISERRAEQIELSISQKRFEEIFKNSPIGLILVQPEDNKINLLNDEVLNMFGFEKDEALKLTFVDVIHPDDLQKAVDCRKRLLAGEIHKYSLESRFRHNDGHYFWAQVHCSLIRTSKGKPHLIITHVEEITDRKELELRLEESTEQFKSSFEYSPNGMALVSIDGKWLRVNRHLTQMLGYAKEEFLELDFQKITHPQDLEIDLNLLKETIAGKRETYRIEKRYIHKNGDIIWGLLNVSLLRDSNGKPLYFISQINDITKIKDSESALKDAVKELQVVMDATTQVSIIETDLFGNIKKFNKGAENLLGYKASEVVDEKTVIILHDQEEIQNRGKELSERYNTDVSGFKVFIQKLDEQDFESREWTYIKKDGTRFPVQLVATSIVDENGKVTGYIGVATDISRLKSVQSALKESEQRWQFALEGSGDGVWDWDIQAGKQFLSSRAKEMIGYDDDDNLEDLNVWNEIIHPDDLILSDQALKEHFEGKAPIYNIEKRIKAKDGSYKWIMDRGKVIERDKKGKPIRMIGTQSDITERKLAEKRIKESEARFRILYEFSPIGIGILNCETGQYLGANTTYLEYLGYTLEEITQLSHQDLTPAAYHEEVQINFSHILENGKFGPYEKELIRKDGTIIPVSQNGVLIKDSNGEDVVLCTIQDVTERKKMEASLVKAKVKAEAASKSKSEFLANMSHEIRTPLNGVIGFTDLLMKTDLTESQLQYMQTVYNSANTLLDLINDILDFSKIEAGKLELSIEKVDVLQLCGQTIDIVKHKAYEKDLEVLLNISPKVNRFVHADAVRLRQIITNLLSNAIKFTEDGEVELKVDVKPNPNNQETMLFSFAVNDTGIGIAPHNLEKIFRAFDQEDASTTRKYGGTGLGLTISNKLLGLMNGKLDVQSTLGKGSTFSFEIELKTESGDAYLDEDLKNIKNVLIIDDNKNNRTILKEMLSIENIHSDLAVNGIEGLEMIESKGTYDVAIIDYNMPYLDGIQVISHIRNILGLSAEDLPIIFLHSLANDSLVQEKCKELDVQFNLNKPIKIDQLFTILKKIQGYSATVETVAKEVKLKRNKKENYNILIAEDNPVNIFLAKTIIYKVLPKANILEAKNGLEAIDKYKNNDIDLIFMDIQMPEMGGFEASSNIRDIEKGSGKHVPIIALTARTIKGEKERSKDFGIDEYVTKPVIFDTIKKVIDDFLMKRVLETSNKNTKAETDTSHFNRKELLEKLGGDEESYEQLMNLVIDNFNDFVPELEQKIEQQDLASIKSMGHSLKGTALNCCFYKLNELAYLLEKLETFDKSHILELKDQVVQEIELLQDQIDTIKHQNL
ncbi:PAS domain S-box protein [Zhouia sp. PK063]|uniref:PAS domain S-box protein n=1 Tax=Zhouia sp. PK063 TaxID=3373602 RepID=UPI00378F46AB